MVLEHRRTIICKSGSADNHHTDTSKVKRCTESITRSKRVQHRRRVLARQNQFEFNEEDNAQADLIEISLAGENLAQREENDFNSNSEPIERLIESAKAGDLRAFQRACTRMMQSHLRLDAPGYMGWTAAHWAAREGHVHLLEHLTICHANLDAVDRKGDTLLHKAAANGQPAACEWLLQRGFSVKIRNNNNLTPLDLAQEHIALSRRSNEAVLCEQTLLKYLNSS
ncbi:hypothetical protein V7S43_008313 [Phytophthora oleae]|uniref:Uncharacterized protein n=1 Tax=Phytophthora oleae TaxID=2107226 RepID=A0ABD3FM78_9STRA